MSSTIPVYSYNPWDRIYSPWQLNFQKFTPEEKPLSKDSQIPNELEDRITTNSDKSEVKDLPHLNPDIATDTAKRKWIVQKTQVLGLLALSLGSLRSPNMGYLTSLFMSWYQIIISMDSLASDKENKARALLYLTVSVAAMVGMTWKHPLGLGFTAGHEALINGQTLVAALGAGNVHLALENLLFLANNSLYIAALFSCSLEIVFISLLLQILVQGYKAYEEFKRGKGLESFAHLLMILARSYQLQPLYHILSFKWLTKANVEIWKDNLSPYEHDIKETLGVKYLYFKKGDHREKFLILNTQSDHNEAFDPKKGAFLENIKQLDERFDIKFRTISKVDDIKNEIDLASQTGQVTGLMLRAHGSPIHMTFGSDPSSGILWKYTIPRETFSKLDPKCVIVLDSCSTAQGPTSSIAYEIAAQSQRLTYAADDVLYASDLRLVSSNPLEWRFDGRGVDKTKIISPKEIV